MITKKTEMPRGRQQLPTTVMCTANEIFSGICYGCKYMFENCLERKYCDYCLQTVKSHIDEAGYEGLSEFSVRKAYHNKSMSQIRRDLKESTGYYE